MARSSIEPSLSFIPFYPQTPLTHDPTQTVQFLLKMSLRSRIQEDPYYRFQSAFDIALAADLGITIDVNQASIDDWLRLPGISIHQARQLVTLSRSGVPFYSISDLSAALNIPLARLQWLAPILSFQYYDESESLLSIKINQATVGQLLQIPQIGSGFALEIVTQREQHGDFANLVDFQERMGLSGRSIGELMHYLQF